MRESTKIFSLEWRRRCLEWSTTTFAEALCIYDVAREKGQHTQKLLKQQRRKSGNLPSIQRTMHSEMNMETLFQKQQITITRNEERQKTTTTLIRRAHQATNNAQYRRRRASSHQQQYPPHIYICHNSLFYYSSRF